MSAPPSKHQEPQLSDPHPFEKGSIIALTADWTFVVESGRIKDRIWDAMKCGDDPDYTAANAAWRKLIDEKNAILARGVNLNRTHKTWEEGTGWIEKPTMEPGPGDKKRAKAIDKELSGHWDAMWQSKATLPAGTEIEIVVLHPLPNFDEGIVKFNVLSTSHPGLQYKKDGGTLSNGKRNFMIRSGEFRSASFNLDVPARAPGM
jgi:hypothetical protein